MSMIQMPVVGTIHSMIKAQQLHMKWQQRKDNPNLPKGAKENPQIVQMRKEAESVRKCNIISSIDGKLKAGDTLSSEELDYLRENCPELYKKAIEVAMEREQYRKALENCKTKEDVERLNTNKMQSFLSRTKAINSNPNIPMGTKTALLDQITRLIMGVKSEHIKFTSTPQYAALPREEELRDEKEKRKEKPAAQVEQDIIDKPHYDQAIEDAAKGDGAKNGDDLEAVLPTDKPSADKPSADKPANDKSTAAKQTGKPASPVSQQSATVHTPATTTTGHTATAHTGGARPKAISLRV